MKISGDTTGFLTQHMQAAYQRTESLTRTIQALPSPQSQLLMDCLEEFQVLLAELEIAQEELQQQNEELLAAQLTIESERRRYQDLFEFAPDGYVVTDIYGAVREANRMAAQLLKVTQERLLSKPLINFVPEGNRRSFRTILNELPTLHRIQEWEIQLCNREGILFDAAITVETMRDEMGKVNALRWLIRDVTARKHSEAQICQIEQQNSELLELDRLARTVYGNDVS